MGIRTFFNDIVSISVRKKQIEMMRNIIHGNNDAVKQTLDEGLDPNRPLAMGIEKLRVRPLFIAAQAGNIEAVKALIEAGANPLLDDKEDGLARDVAQRAGHIDVVGYLVKAEYRQRSVNAKSGKPSL